MTMSAIMFIVGVLSVITAFRILGVDHYEAVLSRVPLDQLLMAQGLLQSAFYLFFPASALFHGLGR